MISTCATPQVRGAASSKRLDSVISSEKVITSTDEDVGKFNIKTMNSLRNKMYSEVR